MRLIRFGTWADNMVTLPVLERTHDQGSGSSRTLLLESPDGQVDLLGNERARRESFNIVYSCVMHSTTTTALQTQLDNIRKLRGKRDKLWMQLESGDLRWAYARMNGASGQNNQRHKLYIPLVLDFAVLSQPWNGMLHNWKFDEGHYFDEGNHFDADMNFALSSGTTTGTITNGGNVDVENAVVTVTAQTSSITALVIKRKVGGVTKEHLAYTGAIPATKSLVIDCGSLSVKNDGTGSLANFSLGADHKYDGWLKLESGANTIEVTRTGGGATSSIEFKFWDAWE